MFLVEVSKVRLEGGISEHIYYTDVRKITKEYEPFHLNSNGTGCYALRLHFNNGTTETIDYCCDYRRYRFEIKTEKGFILDRFSIDETGYHSSIKDKLYPW